MSASEAAFTCWGLAAFFSAAAFFAGAAFVAFENGAAVFVVTVFAMARTSSRLKAIGFVAALRFRMLLRSAFFLEGFSMVGECLAGLAAGLAAGAGRPLTGLAGGVLPRAGGAFLTADFAADDLTDDFLCLAMGSFG
ncbi:MAG: hypothetical protein EXS43_07240 [Opitutus sp.]|nr:hypothetical protein [Opitutus sp.]